MRLLTAVSLLFTAAFAACSTSNPDHCANQQGHATCAARDNNYPYCSKCTASNNGCVSAPVNDACDAGETSTPGTTTTTPSTTDPTTTTPSTTTTASSSTSDPSTSESSTSSTSGETSSGSTTTTATTGDPTGDPPPMCGNDVREPPEVCDGIDLNGLDCVTKDPMKYSGGTLKCTADCKALDEQDCCLATGQTCPLNMQKCCAPGTCVLQCG